MTTEPISTHCTVNHPLGLHLRVGKDLVTIANQFRATITVQNLSRPSPAVDAKSILQLMQLQARQGHILCLSAQGPDAPEALAALRCLLDQTAQLDTTETTEPKP
ncbi:MAG: HPr family phosphocarrier protein [Caldilineaceae bacterium]|nr:HPr family phosphocarrier protein [Caldilineaceae bacterium]